MSRHNREALERAPSICQELLQPLFPRLLSPTEFEFSPQTFPAKFRLRLDLATSHHREPQDPESALGFLLDRIDYERLAGKSPRPPAFRLEPMRQLIRHLGYGSSLFCEEHAAELVNETARLEEAVGLVNETAESAAETADVKGSIPIVHVGGTKGKGSVTNILGHLLQKLGLRTGTYTSPHLESLHWRFCIDGMPANDTDLLEMTIRLFHAEVAMGHADTTPEDFATELRERTEHGSSNAISSLPMEKPSFFELTTAGAFDHFVRNGCEAAILEVGLGGRLDSTNVFDTDVTALTSIGLDHQKILGETHEAIAREKAGILKPKVPLVSGVRHPDAAAVIADRAIELNCPMFRIGREFDVETQLHSHWGQTVRFISHHAALGSDFEFDLPLEGQHQADNAAVAWASAMMLQQTKSFHSKWNGTIPFPENGLANVRVPARLEKFSFPNDVSVVIDTAHNQDSVEALASVIRQRIKNQNDDHGSASHAGCPRVTLIWANSVDKNQSDLLSRLSPVIDALFLTEFQGNPRRIPIADAWDQLPKDLIARARQFEFPGQAWEAAISGANPGDWIVIAGSFFLAAELRPLVRNH